MLPVNNNIAPDVDGMAYRIDSYGDAAKHYSQVTDEHFTQAAAKPAAWQHDDDQPEAEAARNAA